MDDLDGRCDPISFLHLSPFVDTDKITFLYERDNHYLEEKVTENNLMHLDLECSNILSFSVAVDLLFLLDSIQKPRERRDKAIGLDWSSICFNLLTE